MDLKQMFGGKYLITMDESWDAETPENRAEFKAKGEEWWYYELKGKCGTVYPYSETQIAVVLPTRTARRLVKLMGSELTLLQHADDAMCYKAEAKHSAAIVRFIKPKRLRQLTAEQRAAMVARLARYRFQKQKPEGGGLAGKRSVRQLVPQAAYPANPPPTSTPLSEAVPRRLYHLRHDSLKANRFADGHRNHNKKGGRR